MKTKVNKSALIRELYDKGKTIKEIKSKVKCSDALISIVLRKYKKKQKQQSKIVDAVMLTQKELDMLLAPPKADNVNHPPHYKAGGIETIDFIEAKDLNYRLGNVVKYVSRAGKKNSDPVEDLEKAAWYLQREINARKEA